MRPPPVNFALGHGGGNCQKLGRWGAMLTFAWSLQAAATHASPSRLDQTMRFLCSRVMCVLPSSVLCSRHLLSRGGDAKPVPLRAGLERVAIVRDGVGAAVALRCARSNFALPIVAHAPVASRPHVQEGKSA